MTQSMDLNTMGLAPMSEFEMNEIDGGGWIADFIAWAKCGCGSSKNIQTTPIMYLN